MLAGSSLRYYKGIIRFASAINLFPYVWIWDTKSEQFIKRKTFWTVAKYSLQLVCMAFYQVFMVGRALEISQNKRLLVSQKFQVLYLITSFVAMSYNSVNTLLCSETFPLLVNSFLQITKTFHGSKAKSNKSCGNTKRNTDKSNRKISRMISFVLIPPALFVLGKSLAALKRPDAPMFLTSLASQPRKLSKGIILLNAIFNSYMNVVQYFMPTFNIVTAICYVEAVLPVIKELRVTSLIWNPKSIMTNESIYHFYHELKIVQKLFNTSFGFWALGAQMYFVVFSVANIFNAVALHQPRGFFAGTFLMVLACLLFKHLARVYETSKESMQSWKKKKDPLWFRKFCRSCQPLRVAIGSFYHADYSLVLTMVSIIFVNSVNVVVTYKDT